MRWMSWLAAAAVGCALLAGPAMADRDDHHRHGRWHGRWHRQGTVVRTYRYRPIFLVQPTSWRHHWVRRYRWVRRHGVWVRVVRWVWI